MDTKDFANWLQQEHARAGELATVLRERIARVPVEGLDRWLVELRDRFDHLRAHLQKHMALKERGGYLASVLERRPALAADVEGLKSEHRELTRVMNGIHQVLHELKASDPLLIRDTCARIQSLLGYVEQHEARENALALSAITKENETDG